MCGDFSTFSFCCVSPFFFILKGFFLILKSFNTFLWFFKLSFFCAFTFGILTEIGKYLNVSFWFVLEAIYKFYLASRPLKKRQKDIFTIKIFKMECDSLKAPRDSRQDIVVALLAVVLHVASLLRRATAILVHALILFPVIDLQYLCKRTFGNLNIYLANVISDFVDDVA